MRSVPAPCRAWRHCEYCFLRQQVILWPALSRTINLLAILNVSLFFLNGAVKTGGYFFPLISLSLLATASLFSLLPLGLHRRLWFYLLLMVLCLGSGVLLGLSILYWLHTG